MAPKARLRPPYSPKNLAAPPNRALDQAGPGGPCFRRLARPRLLEAHRSQVWPCRRPDIAAISGGTGRTSGDAGVVLLQNPVETGPGKGRTMTKFFVTAAVLSLGAAAGFATAVQAADGPPMPWAWGVNTPPPAVLPPPAPAATPVVPDNTKLLSLPGSKFQFTRAQVANRHAPADWYP